MIREINLTQGFVVYLDSVDYENISKYKWQVFHGRNTKYARVIIRQGNKRKGVWMHRLILGLTDPKIKCDHKDRNGLNNCRSNLRVCSTSENSKNKKAYGSSEYLGVCWSNYHKSWHVSIKHAGKTIFLGRYKDEKEAAGIYNAAAIKYHGEFANLNKL